LNHASGRIPGAARQAGPADHSSLPPATSLRWRRAPMSVRRRRSRSAGSLRCPAAASRRRVKRNPARLRRR
jgi:hypothetical protein